MNFQKKKKEKRKSNQLSTPDFPFVLLIFDFLLLLYPIGIFFYRLHQNFGFCSNSIHLLILRLIV